ncbi:MAG: hypothetical protein Q8S54_19605 [Bacteroidota bacterium]|nr:hypothetical protein [Bacteroidota bacterium]
MKSTFLLKFFKRPIAFIFFSIIILIISATEVKSQTPGLIFDPIPGGGITVLDPNGDGYSSKTTNGFISND